MDEAIKILKGNGVVIFPTDTAIGIGCRIDATDAVKRIYQIRNRPNEKALLVLVSSVDMARCYVTISDDVQEKLINKFWPGGLTIILPCDISKVPEIVRANGTTLAVRLPDNKEICEVIEKVGVPVVAPSANYSGETTPFENSEVDKSLIKKVDFVLEGMCTMRGVSTIVDCTVNPWKIIRQGVVTI